MPLIVILFIIWSNISYGFFEEKYEIKLTTESEIENCLGTLEEIVANANIIVLSKGGSLKISEIFAEVTKDPRRAKCNYNYTASGNLLKQDGKQEKILFKGKAYGTCIRK